MARERERQRDRERSGESVQSVRLDDDDDFNGLNSKMYESHSKGS